MPLSDRIGYGTHGSAGAVGSYRRYGASTVQGLLVTSALLACIIAIAYGLLTRRWTMPWLMLSVLLGVTQLGGLCGRAHFTSMKVIWSTRRSSWLAAVLAYTSAGALSACAMGAAIGGLGMLAGLDGSTVQLSGALVVGAALCLREFDVPKWRLPEWRVQTNRNWMYQYGWVTASGMWGFHIGLGFFTVITYGSFWLLVAVVIATGEPLFGAAVFGSYWFGRALPMWAAPRFVAEYTSSPDVDYRRYRPYQLMGFITGLVILSTNVAARSGLLCSPGPSLVPHCEHEAK